MNSALKCINFSNKYCYYISHHVSKSLDNTDKTMDVSQYQSMYICTCEVWTWKKFTCSLFLAHSWPWGSYWYYAVPDIPVSICWAWSRKLSWRLLLYCCQFHEPRNVLRTLLPSVSRSGWDPSLSHLVVACTFSGSSASNHLLILLHSHWLSHSPTFWLSSSHSSCHSHYPGIEPLPGLTFSARLSDASCSTFPYLFLLASPLSTCSVPDLSFLGESRCVCLPACLSSDLCLPKMIDLPFVSDHILLSRHLCTEQPSFSQKRPGFLSLRLGSSIQS